MSAAVFVLWVAWGTAVFGIYRAEIVAKLDPVLRYLVLASAASVLSVGAVLLGRWITLPRDKMSSQSNAQRQPPSTQPRTEGLPKAALQPPPPALPQAKHTPSQALHHRQSILRGLVQEYLLSHDGLTAAELAGTEITQQEADWINRRLQEKGETWRVSPTTKQQPPAIIQTAPTFGNLKERAIRLSQEIMEDLYVHGWPQHGWPPGSGQQFPRELVFRQMPTKEPERGQWDLARTRVFRFMFLPKVLDIRNEFAQLHIRDNQLDDVVRYTEGRPENYIMLPQEIESVAERLKVMADQIK